MGLNRQISLLVIPRDEEGPNFRHFDRETGVFRMSEDQFYGPMAMDVVLSHLARLVAVLSHEENPNPTETVSIDIAQEVVDLERFEQNLIIRAAAYSKARIPPVPGIEVDEDDDEPCSEKEALTILGNGMLNMTFAPPGIGRGAVSYSWRDGGEFMIRAESAMATDSDGKHHFTDTEYRKVRVA